MNSKIIVEPNEYVLLDRNNPIGYVKNLNTCIAVLIHRSKHTALINIESHDNIIDLENYLELLKPTKDDKIISVDMFRGYNTSNGNMSILKFILHRLNIPYTESDLLSHESSEDSIGYNFITKEYFQEYDNQRKLIIK